MAFDASLFKIAECVFSVGHCQRDVNFESSLTVNNIVKILVQYRHIGSRSANITILGQCCCEIISPGKWRSGNHLSGKRLVREKTSPLSRKRL